MGLTFLAGGMEMRTSGPTAAGWQGAVRSRLLVRVAMAAVVGFTTMAVSVVIPLGVVRADAATAWTVSASYPPTQVSLRGVSCPSTARCFAVGYISGGDGQGDFNGGVIMATTNGGASWAKQSVPPMVTTGFGSGLQSIVCPSVTDCFATGVSSSAGGVVLGTTDGGAQWTVRWSGTQAPTHYADDVTAVACPSTIDCYALADNEQADNVSGLLATTDGGTTWTSLAFPPNTAQMSGITCQSLTNCFVVGGSEILETPDGGSSWITQTVGSSDTFALFSVDCPSSTTCYAAGGRAGQASTSGGVIFTTTDSGVTWTGQSVPIANVNTITCTSTDNCFGGGSPDGYTGGMISTTNGGKSWFTQDLPIATGIIYGLTCPSASTCFTTEDGGFESENSVILEGPGAGTSTTQTAMTLSTSSAAAGQRVTYSATVTGIPGTSSPRGKVTFDSGAVPLCVVTLVGGNGSCTSTDAPVGVDDVTGTYSGDNNFFGSSGTGSLDVGSSTTSISANPSPALPGQQVTYSADVTADVGTGTPAGIVTFAIGATPLCSATLAGGSGTCTSSASPSGNQTVTGSYSGNSSFQGSSGTAVLDVGLATTTTVSVPNPSSEIPGQQVAYSADVAPTAGTGTPTGTVAFTVGTTPLCVATLHGGTGSCYSFNAPMGHDVVSGTYSGDSDYTGSAGTSPLLIQTGTYTTVSATPVALAATQEGVAPGQQVTYSATVAAYVGTGTPTGIVTFTIGPAELCVATLAEGTGSCSTNNAPVGVHKVIGTYSGDSNFVGSEGQAPVVVGPTTTTVSLSPSPVSMNQAVTYSANVAADVGAGSPTGTVTFSVGITQLCVATLVGGSGSCSASNAPVGMDNVVGTYSGDSNDAGSSGASVLAVGPTTTTVSMSPPSAIRWANVTYSATVVSDVGGAPTGTVTFTIEDQSLCTANLVNGRGSCTSADAAADAPAGSAEIVTGEYSGDSGDAGSSGSATLGISLNPSRTMASTTPAFGQNVWFSGIVTPYGGEGTPSGTVTLTMGGLTLCTATMADGTFSCLATNVPWGTNSWTATYGGDSTFAGSSCSWSLFLGQPSVTTVSAQPTSVVTGHQVTYSTKVKATSGGTPSGTVTFTDGSTDLCLANLVGGSGSCTASSAPVGVHAVIGTYSGDSEFAGSEGWATVDVVKAATITIEKISPARARWRQSVDFSAAVVTKGGTAVGSVVFSVGSTTLCRAALVGGVAECQSKDAPFGSDAVRATYSGNADFLPSSTTTTFVSTLLSRGSPRTY